MKSFSELHQHLSLKTTENKEEQILKNLRPTLASELAPYELVLSDVTPNS